MAADDDAAPKSGDSETAARHAGRQAFLAVSSSPCTTTSQITELRLAADTYGNPLLHEFADRLAGIEAIAPKATPAAPVHTEAARVVGHIAAGLLEETPAECMRREATELLREYDALGATCSAAGIIARRRTSDPLGRERIAQRVRALVRRRKINEDSSV